MAGDKQLKKAVQAFGEGILNNNLPTRIDALHHDPEGSRAALVVLVDQIHDDERLERVMEIWLTPGCQPFNEAVTAVIRRRADQARRENHILTSGEIMPPDSVSAEWARQAGQAALGTEVEFVTAPAISAELISA